MIESNEQIAERKARALLIAHKIEIGDDPRSNVKIAEGLGYLGVSAATEVTAPQGQSPETTL